MKKLFLLSKVATLGCFLLFLSINGCAPVFSEMQDARTVGKNNVEGTASFSSVGFTDNGESGHAQNHVGFQAAYGVTDAFDFRLRYALVILDRDIEDANVNVLAVGPKVSLIKDRLSFYLPVGFAFGETISKEADTWQIHPTLLVTIPVVDKLDINPSFKVLLPFEEELETTIAFNLGLGIRINESFIVRPEYGMLFNPEYGMLFHLGEEGHLKQFGIGVTYSPSPKID